MFIPRVIKTVSLSVRDAFTPAEQKRWRWYHGAAWIVGANALAFIFEGLAAWAAGNAESFQLGSQAQREYFRELNQAVFTPPAWFFGPAWITNNILTVAGTLRVLNKPQGTPGRSTFLLLQAASWLIFISFNALYVGLRSPVHGFIFTFAMLILTVASLVVALRTLEDKLVAWSLATLLIWTILASAVALCQALWNYDQLYNAGPFTQAPDWLLRQ